MDTTPQVNSNPMGGLDQINMGGPPAGMQSNDLLGDMMNTGAPQA